MTNPRRSRTVAAGRPRAPARRRTSTRAEIDAFLSARRAPRAAPAAGKRGRLIFALDATMSRQPTWDTACRLQADMFREAAADRRARCAARLLPRA